MLGGTLAANELLSLQWTPGASEGMIAAREAGALDAAVSGAGPTVIALATDTGAQISQREDAHE
ncbi:MAG: hypothetical protein ACE5JM_12610 [Armatimonadota bacterium]